MELELTGVEDQELHVASPPRRPPCGSRRAAAPARRSTPRCVNSADLALPDPARGDAGEHQEELPPGGARGRSGPRRPRLLTGRPELRDGPELACEQPEKSGTAFKRSICCLGIRLPHVGLPLALGLNCWERRLEERTAPSRRVPGLWEVPRAGSPAVAQALAQHELLDLARGGPRQLVDDPDLLGPLLAGQARLLAGAPAARPCRGPRSRAACGRRRSRARRAARRVPPPPPPRPRPSCGPGAAPPRRR